MRVVGIKREFVERRVRLVGSEHAIRRLELWDGSFALGCSVATAIMTQVTHVDRPCGFHHYGLI